MNHITTDVFGVRSKLIESYIERNTVDTKFKSALTDGNEVIVYGSSKQGKTFLILKHLDENDYVKIDCSPQTQPIDIYKSILRQLNITSQVSGFKIT
jgi:Cdc6-like AAA superfamily ATPase